jgi:CheY-like chemotaxis protein
MGTDLQSQTVHFVLIDDDKVSNMLAKNIIKRYIQLTEFTVFTDPEKALLFLKTVETPVVVLLDINMPILSGWDVLERIERFPRPILDLLKIYIVSSSIDTDDHQRAAGNHLVLGYLEKPITSGQIMMHFATLNTN